MFSKIAQAIPFRKKLPYKWPRTEDNFSTNVPESYDYFEGAFSRLQQEEIASARLDPRYQTGKDDFPIDTPEPYDFYEGMVLNLQLEEIDSVQPDSKGKGRENLKSNTEVAWEIQQKDTQPQSTSASDEEMAWSMAMAMETDMEAIAKITAQDILSSKDRELAMVFHQHEERISSLKSSTPQSNQQEAAIDSYQKNLDRVAMAKSFQSRQKPEPQRIDHRIPTAESSRTAMKREPLVPLVNAAQPIAPDQQECTACRDDVPIFDLSSLPCGHDYCKSCLSTLFANSMTNESEFPPRCCKTLIVQDYIGMYLDSNVAAKFNAKREELSTINRTYCQNSKCSTFIPKSCIENEIGSCLKCKQKTCTICKKASHKGNECPDDPVLATTIELAKEQRWQRCGKCWTFVELVEGCYHMKCRCGYEFCYTCGSKWHTCKCQQSSTPHLLERARVV